jgi:hypothetical protein
VGFFLIIDKILMRIFNIKMLYLILVGTCDLHTVCEGGEIGEEVRSVGKVTRETKGIPSSSVNLFYFLFP